MKSDPVAAFGDVVFEDAQSELRVGEQIVARDDEVHFSVVIEVVGDDVTTVFLEADAEQVSDIGEAMAGLIQEQSVTVVAAVGIALAAGSGELALEIVVECVVGGLGADEAIMQPILAFVIVDGGAAFQAIGDVDIGPAIVFDVECCAAPGPA